MRREGLAPGSATKACPLGELWRVCWALGLSLKVLRERGLERELRVDGKRHEAAYKGLPSWTEDPVAVRWAACPDLWEERGLLDAVWKRQAPAQGDKAAKGSPSGPGNTASQMSTGTNPSGQGRAKTPRGGVQKTTHSQAIFKLGNLSLLNPEGR